MKRQDRRTDDMRLIHIDAGVPSFAEGACLFTQGHTRVLCLATVEKKLPAWKEQVGGGWITAEYAMLPRSNRQRTPREAVVGKQSGRTMEIARLIGRSLRACVDLSQLNGLTITVDCDVLQADGGTRCASISGAYVALRKALEKAVELGLLSSLPAMKQVAAVSVGKSGEDFLLDLDYLEDSGADVDLNLVMLYPDQLVEVQGTSEGATFTQEELSQMVRLAAGGVTQIFEKQREAL